MSLARRNPLSTGAKVALGVAGLAAGGAVLYAVTREEEKIKPKTPSRGSLPSVGIEGTPALPFPIVELYRYKEHLIGIMQNTLDPGYTWLVYTPDTQESALLKFLVVTDGFSNAAQFSGTMSGGATLTLESARVAAEKYVDAQVIPEPPQSGLQPDPAQPPGLPKKWYFVGGGWVWPDKHIYPVQEAIASALSHGLGYTISGLADKVADPSYNIATDLASRAAVKKFQADWNVVADPLVWGTYIVGIPGATTGRPAGKLSRDGLIGSSTWKAMRWAFNRKAHGKQPSWPQLVDLGKGLENA